MGLGDELIQETADVFAETFQVSKGWAIPSTSDVAFGSQGKQIKLVALFVDIRKSTTIVNTLGLTTAARMYKAYTRGITRIVRARGGKVLSFNGDGIVAGFVGAQADNAAILTALNVNWLLYWHIKPQVDATLMAAGTPGDVWFDYGIGVDSGDVLVVKSGMAGDDNNDLIWAGNPVNYAVKVASFASLPQCIYVADSVFTNSHFSLSMDGDKLLWTAWLWPEKNKLLWHTNWFYGADYIKSVPESDPPKPVPLLPPAKPTLLEMLAASSLNQPVSVLDPIQPKPKLSLSDAIAIALEGKNRK